MSSHILHFCLAISALIFKLYSVQLPILRKKTSVLVVVHAVCIKDSNATRARSHTYMSHFPTVYSAQMSPRAMEQESSKISYFVLSFALFDGEEKSFKFVRIEKFHSFEEFQRFIFFLLFRASSILICTFIAFQRHTQPHMGHVMWLI